MFKIPAENVLLFMLGAFVVVRGIFVVKDECPPNEEYLLCGTACPVNCSDLATPVVCSEDCAEGCFCTAGLVRDENGTCVRPDQCANSTICPEDEEFLTCGLSCPPSCSDPVPGPCDLACRVGCFCKGLLLRDDAGKCVAAENCPAEPCLNENEVYDNCNAGCEPSCADPEPICNKMCVGGCVCATGLMRADAGDCVSVDKCPVNGTDVALLAKYLNAINNILRL